MTDFGFPVHIHKEGTDLPKEGTYFVVSGNGLWMHKDTGIVRAFVPVKSISVLDDLDASAYVECNLPKIPARSIWRIKKFFQEVVSKYRAESATILYYSKEHNDFKIHIPEQSVSHGGVQYKRVALIEHEGMESYLRVGTIHSHCDFGAFHSGTDVGDEEDFDGIHGTFGHNDKDEFSIVFSVVVNGNRVQIDPMEIIEGIEHVDGEYYRLTPVSAETAEERGDDLDVWMRQVNGGNSNGWGNVFRRGQSDIHKGGKVDWAGDLKTVNFKDICGEGPFSVESVESGFVVINAKIGLARFPEKLFKKA